jgi:N6-adenosine-specific RNA methylase IME4
MDVEELCNLPVVEIVGQQAHLHLWTTNAFLEEAFEVIRAWGFEFKSMLIWCKDKIGLGNYWRVSHEYLMFASRGNLPMGDARHIPSWLIAERGRHSAKPHVFRQLVEGVSPPPRVELFGRAEHEGWIVMGNQIERTLWQ